MKIAFSTKSGPVLASKKRHGGKYGKKNQGGYKH